MGFQYSFNVKDDIPSFDMLPEKQQWDVEKNIVMVIYDSFIVTADQDYLTARMFSMNNLYRSFFWSAAQAIEKYLKGFLLLNGKSVLGSKKSNGHSLIPFLKIANEIDPSIISINLDPHPSLRISPWAKDNIDTFGLQDFVRKIEELGNPNNRYNSSGIDFNTGYLFALDKFVYEIRSRIHVLDIRESFKHIGMDLIKAFNVNNPYFNQDKDALCCDIPSKEFPIHLSLTATQLDFLKKNRESGFELRWLKLKMKL
jgi:hypothetical protein